MAVRGELQTLIIRNLTRFFTSNCLITLDVAAFSCLARSLA
jgi:hypothetical protein